MADSAEFRVKWMWKSNLDPWSSTEEENWISYTDVENTIIEDAFQKKKDKVRLDKYLIDFIDLVQVSNQNKNHQRPIKRTQEKIDQMTISSASDSFLIKPEKAFSPGCIGTFLWEAFTVGKWRDVDLQTLVQRAIQGLIEEGARLGKEEEAKRMVEKLRNVQNGTQDEIWYSCVRLYTMETFLYKRINETLRLVSDEQYESDWKKAVPTLGLFIWFLFDYPENLPEFKGRLYRGMRLSDEIVAQLVLASKIGEIRSFQGFGTAHKDLQVAQHFGSTLFIIDACSNCLDISPVSDYPNEQECLLNPSFTFKMMAHQYDSETNINIFNVQDTSF
jgi:hypothetical protein